MSAERPLKIAVLAGEESGDLLAHDLVAALTVRNGRPVDLVGIGGRHLVSLGLKPYFEASDIALMGIGAVVSDLPRLILRIGSTARRIAAERPDCLLTVDSPDFALRVAAKVRAIDSTIPVVHYVCPSVWAWRPGRAPAMKPHVDRILCLLPFEPNELERLGGPRGTFVGHRLTSDPGLLAAAAAQRDRPPRREGELVNIVVLPGSRRSEVTRLLAPFGETVKVLAERGNRLSVTVPTVPHVAPIVERAVAGWAVRPTVTHTREEKWRAFGQADAALAASGTVSLELALCGVPLISCYRFDALSQLFQNLIVVWSASLPNIVADRVIVPEYYNAYVRPLHIARQLESLVSETRLRAWQKDGFAEIWRRMRTDRPAGDIAADAVLETIGEKRRAGMAAGASADGSGGG